MYRASGYAETPLQPLYLLASAFFLVFLDVLREGTACNHVTKRNAAITHVLQC